MVTHRLTVVHRLKRDSTWCVPVSLVYTEMGRFFFSLDGPDQNMGMDWFSWKEIGKSKGSNVKKKIECSNTCGDPPVYLNIEGVCQEIFNERASELTQVRFEGPPPLRVLLKPPRPPFLGGVARMRPEDSAQG